MSAPEGRFCRTATAVVGIVVALAVVGTVSSTASAGSTGVQAARIQVAADSITLKPAVRVTIPTAPVRPAVEADVEVVNRSNCRTSTAEPSLTITIPDVSYQCPVYSGGQSMIDGGFVTLVTDRGTSPALALRPGDPGTLWIAAHRSSHGGAFAAVPDLADGAIVTVADGIRTATYRVVGRVRVEVRNGLVVDADGQATHDATVDSIIRTDRGGNLAARLLLQTCDGENYRWMIYADLIG